MGTFLIIVGVLALLVAEDSGALLASALTIAAGAALYGWAP